MIFDSIYYEINGKPFFRGIYLKIEQGKICGLFGRNGSGKSTLIKIGAGIVLPAAGAVFIGGNAFATKKLTDRYKMIACLPQETFLPQDISVSQFLKALPGEVKEYVCKYFSSNLFDQYIGSLSGGELRLLEIIFIFSLDRKFLLLDEPFSGIEPIYIEKMMTLILEQRSLGKGILITDHYYRYSTELSDYAYFIKNGTCYRLAESEPLTEQLQRQGYLKS